MHTIGSGTALSLSGFLTGTTGGLVKDGAGSATLNTRAFFTGQTTVNGGTLTLNGGNNTLLVNATATVPTVVAVEVNSGVLDLNNTNEVIGTLSSNDPASGTGGTITNSGATTVTLTSVTAASTFSGSIAGSLNFAKYGNAALTLTGANTYTGTTTIGGNTLTLKDGGSIASTQIALNYGTLALDQSGLTPLNSGNPNYQRIDPNAVITMQGGAFTLQGGGSFDTSLTLKSVTVQGGSNTISSLPAVNEGSTNTLTLNDLEVTGGLTTMVNFAGTVGGLAGATGTTSTLGGTGLNANSRIYINTLNGSSFGVAFGSLTNNLIGGWAVVDGTSFATYSDVLGVRALNTSATANSFAKCDGANVAATRLEGHLEHQ